MQATVSVYDSTTQGGQVLTDAGRALTFDQTSVSPHIRHLRPGQRVFVEADGDVVTDLRIWK